MEAIVSLRITQAGVKRSNEGLRFPKFESRNPVVVPRRAYHLAALGGRMGSSRQLSGTEPAFETGLIATNV
jgi:hypothetical protein